MSVFFKIIVGSEPTNDSCRLQQIANSLSTVCMYGWLDFWIVQYFVCILVHAYYD